MKNNRLFGIIYLLLSEKMMTAKALADYFEVSTRTIYRDIETLSELNIPIYMSQGKHGGIGLLSHYKLDKSLLTDEEQHQILFSLQGIDRLNADRHHLYEKMKAIFSKEDESWFEVDFSVWGKSDEHQKHFEIIKQSILSQQVIQFIYFNTRGKQTERKVEPLKLCFKHNAWYLWGFDQHKQADRFFKITRIKDVVLLDETFERRPISSVEIPLQSPNMVSLVLQIDASQSYRVYDEFGEANIQKSDQGNFIVSVDLPLNEWVYGYILSFGQYVEVLEPSHIRHEIQTILQKSLDHYS